MPVLLAYCARLVLVPSFPFVVVLVNMYWAVSSLKTKFAHSFVVIVFSFFLVIQEASNCCGPPKTVFNILANL